MGLYIIKTTYIMKKTILITTCLVLAVLGAFALTASRTDKTVKLPDKAHQFLKQHFPNIQISNAEKEKGKHGKTTYNVSLANGFEIDFDDKGEWYEVDGDHQALPAGIVPNKIAEYVKRKHAGQQIVHIEHNSKGYEAELTNGEELKFKPDGSFLKHDN